MSAGRRRGWLGLFLVVAVAATSCRGARFDQPDLAYASFLSALRQGEAKAAYECLSSESKRLYEERARELARASGGSLHEDPAMLAFGTGVRPQKPDTIKVVQVEKETALVEVTVGGRVSTQAMVREGTRWMVDLSGAIKK